MVLRLQRSTFLVIYSIVKMVRRAEIIEKPIKVEVIPRRVKPETVLKLQADVIALEKDVADKRIVINKLQTDIGLQDERIKDLENVVTP